ncbi:hypothetical protein DF3PA_10017 [Candidatus Defluviicoccus seviourii]|uniref:Uncharacterized protein n=1 Tax=Candidatus Defluviicoccus seviourii TaxID=2565273 RepID=A0A564WAB8_9PROT|nr:hypothetical protein DF3PA_10017 [Candidatus Defluviicoccus seviourii]
MRRIALRKSALRGLEVRRRVGAAIALEKCYQLIHFDSVAVIPWRTLSWSLSPFATSPRRRIAP